jgi:hypothetical protein
VPSVQLKPLTGRSAAPLQGEGRRFDPYSAHHQKPFGAREVNVSPEAEQ